MSGRMKVGDRVRVTRSNRVLGYYPGDTGTVRLDSTQSDGDPLYVVEMDKDPFHIGIVFAAYEIEPDVL